MFHSKAVLWSFAVVAILCCVICGGFVFPEMGVGLWEGLPGVLSAFLVISFMVSAFRIVNMFVLFVKRKKDNEHREKFENSLANIYWLVVCIIIIAGYPMIAYLQVMNRPIAEGQYNIEGEYRVSEDANLPYGYEYSGKALFTVEITYDYDYEGGGGYYAGGYEHEGTNIVVSEAIQINEVTIPGLGGITFDYYQDYSDWLDDEIEVDGEWIHICYELGEITEESLGYTYSDRIMGIKLTDKLQFVVTIAGAMISIAFFYLIKNHYRSSKY